MRAQYKFTDISDEGMIEWREDMFRMIKKYCDKVKSDLAFQRRIRWAIEHGILVYGTSD